MISTTRVINHSQAAGRVPLENVHGVWGTFLSLVASRPRSDTTNRPVSSMGMNKPKTRVPDQVTLIPPSPLPGGGETASATATVSLLNEQHMH